jgi:hypothetical protein
MRPGLLRGRGSALRAKRSQWRREVGSATESLNSFALKRASVSPKIDQITV